MTIKYEVEVDGEGNRYWHVDGNLHREDGPAIEYADGTKQWFLNGERHRAEGPAIEWANGDKEWWLNDELHRVEGPTIEHSNGDMVNFIMNMVRQLNILTAPRRGS